MRLSGKDRDIFWELETALHKKQVRNSRAAVSELLADEFIEFGSSGRTFNKSQIIEALEKEKSDQQVEVEDFDAQELAPAVVLVTYVVKGTRTLRSSIWKSIDGRWQMVFYQGTKAP
jgi:hypothetical protein